MVGWINGWMDGRMDLYFLKKKAFISDFVLQENKMLDSDWPLETRVPQYSPC